MSRADKFSLEQKKREIYSDFLNSFDSNPFTGQLARVTNEQAVAQAIKNIVLTMHGERFYNSRKGSRIRSSLFETYDDTIEDIIKLDLRDTLAVYEPRALINDIVVQDNLDGNSIGVTIIFQIIN